MQRASVAIPSNIAEGSKRNHRKEFIQFLAIAIGSAAELETQLIITKQQYNIAAVDKILELLDEVLKMLYGLIQALKRS